MVPKNNLGELVAAAKRKDNTAISVLYEQTHQRIYFTTLMIVKNEQDALDIMQETYMSAIRKLDLLKIRKRLRIGFRRLHGTSAEVS